MLYDVYVTLNATAAWWICPRLFLLWQKGLSMARHTGIPISSHLKHRYTSMSFLQTYNEKRDLLLTRGRRYKLTKYQYHDQLLHGLHISFCLTVVPVLHSGSHANSFTLSVAPTSLSSACPECSTHDYIWYLLPTRQT